MRYFPAHLFAGLFARYYGDVIARRMLAFTSHAVPLLDSVLYAVVIQCVGERALRAGQATYDFPDSAKAAYQTGTQ